MTPQQFISKWRNAQLNERAASQSHFNDLCALLELDDPITADPKGEWYAFEKGATKTSGGEGWADVWRRGCFAWEYKGKKKDLDKAFAQLQQYAIALENPPLLIVSDMDRFRIHTNWTNTVHQVHEFALDDLTDGATRDLLRSAFENPEQLRPSKTRQMLTEEAAQEFAQLAQRLRDRGHEAHQVAHFVNRLVFCMFAEDVRLLPDHMFTAMLKASISDPSSFAANARTLFGAMKAGGLVGFTKVEWFNGGLFDDDEALPLDRDDIDNLITAAALDWSEIDPSILGTLFERGLDPDKRSQLGAHYTDRDKIMQIVEPVIIRPLTAEWTAIRDQIAELIANAPQQTAEKLLRGAEKTKRDRAFSKAQELLRGFVVRLRTFRVLDPACGSGNFLYLSLLALKDLEHRANLEAEALGCSREFPAVGPESVLGIELNPYAAELARVSVWIGEIQWMRRNGFEASRNPILRSLGNIECRDAIVTFDEQEQAWREAIWPQANVIVGNPPFLGGKSMRRTLGEEATAIIRQVYEGRLAAISDLVCYWFEKARFLLANGSTERCGFVATKAIAKNANLPVLVRLAEAATIYDAWQNEPWVVDGAAVRVSLVCAAIPGCENASIRLDGKDVPNINPNLTTGLETTKVARLVENADTVFIGIQQSGPFTISRAQAVEWLLSPSNPNGKRNSTILSAYVATDDVVGRTAGEFFIDFPSGLSETEASAYERPFEYLRNAVYDPHRDGELVNFRHYRVTTEGQNPSWWEPHRTRPALRSALSGVREYLATGETTEHRVFRFLPAHTVPDKSLYAFPSLGMVGFGILQSYVHEHWCTYFGNRIGTGNQRRYNASYVYLTFPFPEGLTPDTPAAAYADDPRAQAIATAAARLNELRENWLNPPDLIERVPEVVPGYPDRVLPKDEAAAEVLKKRTLTNLYNQRPAWLDHAHRALDEAVADAYGWGNDFRTGTLTDDEILARLFRLNQERAGFD